MLASLLGALILAAIGVALTARQFRLFSRELGWVTHTHRVLLQISETRLKVREAQRSARDFLITADEASADESGRKVDEIRAAIAELRSLVADNPAQVNLTDRLRVELETARSRTLEIFAERRRTDLAAMMPRLAAPLGAGQPSPLDATLGEMFRREEALLAPRTSALDRAETRVAATLVVLGLVSLAMIVAAFARLRSEILQRAAAETRIAATADDVAATNRELEAFSYSVSHDLRAPLRAVDGFARILEEDHAASLDAEGRRLLGVVRSGAQRMGRLIDDLLAFSRAGRVDLKPSRVDMGALAARVFAELAPDFRGELVLGELPPSLADATLIQQVWQNLLGNAIKFSQPREHPRIEVGFDRRGYFVRDNGVGFDPRYAHKLFVVFERLHPASTFEGTGVGLALARRIVARHGGTMGAESTLNEGATFWFHLPEGGKR